MRTCVRTLICFVFLIALSLSAAPSPTKTLTYVTHGGKSLKLDLWLPKSGKKPWPLVIWIHGGAWRSSTRKNIRSDSFKLLNEGIALASIDYRYSREGIYPAQIRDCKAAVRFLRANAGKYNLNPNAFGVWGNSSGGHLAALVGTTGDVTTHTVGKVTMDLAGKSSNPNVSDRVQAAAAWSAPTNFLLMDNDPKGTMNHNAADSPESNLIGGAIQKNPDKCAMADPATFASSDDPPFQILHGTEDHTVPLNQAQHLNAALKKAGTEIEYITMLKFGHGQKWDPIVFTKLISFMKKNLTGIDPNAPLPGPGPREPSPAAGPDFSAPHVKLSFGGTVQEWDDGDLFVTGGEAFTFSGEADVTGLTDPAPAEVYQSVIHRGTSTENLTISFPDVNNGTYTLRFHVVDAFGGRAMDISAEGTMLVENLDPITEGGGEMMAVVKDAEVTVSDGNGLEIVLSDDRAEPKDVFLSGLEIVARTASPRVPAIRRPSRTSASRRTATLRFNAAGDITSAGSRSPGISFSRSGIPNVLNR